MFLSIIVPMYNTEEYIRDMLNSIHNQDFDDYEIILVDDGSSDNTLSVAKECAEGNERISVYHKENGGQSSARNLGMRKALGEYILFVDSDDQLAPNVLGRMVSLVKDNNLDILRGKLLIVQDNTEDRHDNVEIPETLMSGKERLISGGISYSICAHMYRRRFLEENAIEFIEGVYHEDMDFIVRSYAYADRVMDMDVFFYIYCMRSGSTTHMISKKRVFDYYRVADSVYALSNSINDKELHEGYFREYLAFLFSRVVNMCAENKLPIKEIMNDRDRCERIISCLKSSKQKKYRIQAMLLKMKLYSVYAVIYQIKGSEK